MNANTIEAQPKVSAAPAVGGMEVDSNGLVVGKWKAGILDCFADCVPNCCMAYWCPCISLAQTVHRIGLGTYSRTLAIFGVLYAATYISSVVAGQFATYYEGNVYNTKYSFFAYFSNVFAVGCAIGVMIVRGKLRQKLKIPGSCFQDCLCGFFCNCCSIAQMATQTDSYTTSSCNFGPKDTLPGYSMA
ncbi:PLAC8 family protein [Achlya hypogyna]|uniref:PLAC8 family protein n=1 Tax=Achlya hypogyna TaxID=1202772 RepID=A0A1V9Y6H7_ACHHY|nr:PLAC8 family protein [Achlya hypogyna]